MLTELNANGPISQSVLIWIRLNQLPYKTEDLVQRMLKGFPADRISAQDSLQHPYFSTLPPPIMHLRDSKDMLTQLHLTR